MGDTSDQLEFKEILVSLEDEHVHLQASIKHLQKKIEKRELEIRKLLADRQLSILNQAGSTNRPQSKLMKSQSVDFRKIGSREQGDTRCHSRRSVFSEQVDKLLASINKTSGELIDLIKL